MGQIPIPSFHPEDFPSWHFEMQSYLLAQKCWLAIEGDQDQWDKFSMDEQEEKSVKAFNILQHALGREYQYIAREFELMEPAKLWEKLEDMFQRTDPQMHLSLAKRFSDLTWKSHHHVESFLADLREL